MSARPVVLIYWLTLAGGLALLSFSRPEMPELLPLWAGALAGTALGQGLALVRMRFWVGALAIGTLVIAFAGVIATGAPAPLSFLAAFVPAAVCGLASLGDGRALVAFWFPAVPWMVWVLDRVEGGDAPDQIDVASGVALAALALLFVLLLRATERRRVALWQKVAPTPLTTTEPPSVLRESPARRVARMGVSAALAAAAAVVVVELAPLLWQHEQVAAPPEAPRELVTSQPVLAVDRVGPVATLPCCHQVLVPLPHARVREYLDVEAAHPRPGPTEVAGVNCQPCQLAAAAAAAVPAGPPVATAAVPPPMPTPAPLAPAPPAPHEPVSTPVPAPVPTPPPPAVASAPPTTQPISAAPARSDPAAWLRTILAAAFLLVLGALGLRPLRRALILRHLRRPFFPETVGQRVSNLWQLARIGLRDAGFRTSTGEPPGKTARRIPVPGLATCATVLERARHGLAVDQQDLSAMRSAAESVYRAARSRVGSLMRALSWLRWPLA
ncbi:MAG TPA: hypothetical protein VKN99_12055 [Polyangia bacterium]|nr:hypothetical protein [Polyangia bacterium]